MYMIAAVSDGQYLLSISKEAVSKDHHHQIWLRGRSHYVCTNATFPVFCFKLPC